MSEFVPRRVGQLGFSILLVSFLVGVMMKFFTGGLYCPAFPNVTALVDQSLLLVLLCIAMVFFPMYCDLLIYFAFVKACCQPQKAITYCRIFLETHFVT